jgi:hypothetical protein
MYPMTRRMKRNGWVKNRVNRIHAGSNGSDHVRLLKYHVKCRKGVGAADPAIHGEDVCIGY